MKTKPIILWLADHKGWAYDQIYQNQSSVLTGYEHHVFYTMGDLRGDAVPWVDLGIMIERADIIVCMHLIYFIQIKAMQGDKVVAMLTGPRAWE